MGEKPLTPQIERISIDKLIPYARNSRTHSEAQVAQIAASIREFGFTNPVLIDADDGIIAGHGRVLAARKLKMADVPCIRLSHLNEAQRRLYVIADNKLALNAGWDMQMLSLEIGDLKGLDLDLSLTGFSSEEVGALLAKAGTHGLTDPDDVPEAPETPIACVGDVWLLGRHRLVCGDCTDPLVVDKALAGVKPHLMVTDPPYGVEYDPDWRNRAIRSDGGRPNGRAIGTVLNDNRSDWREAWALFPGDVAYCWHADRHASNTQLAFEECGFQLRSQIIWAKQQFAIGRGHYHVQHEPCFYMVRKGTTGHWASDRKQTTLWQIDKPRKSETGHSTQKPVECMKRPIENNSSPGQAVYEPFSGSGTTIIAAEMTGRTCHAIELNPAYIDVAVKRWEQFTGQKATREQAQAQEAA
ncbi:MAG: site-specific DNA-methyltransferase [Alphaproteobacteria bacterium]